MGPSVVSGGYLVTKKVRWKKKWEKKYKNDKFITRKNFLEISSLYLRKMEKKMVNLLFLVFFFFQHPNMIKYFCPSPFFSASKHAKIIFLKTLFPCPFYFLEIKHRYLNLLLCYLFSYRLVFLWWAEPQTSRKLACLWRRSGRHF